MSNDGTRKPDNGLDGAEIASTSVAVPLDGATQAQIGKGREIAQALSRDGLTIYVAAKGGELEELPIGDAIDVLNARKEITDVMAISLKALYETALTRLGKTDGQVRQDCENPIKKAPEAAEKTAAYRPLLEAIQEGARETLPNPATRKQEKNPHYGDFSYHIDLEEGATRVSIIEAIAWLEHKGHLNATQADRLRSACKANMQNTGYRKGHGRNGKKLTAKEIEEELATLDVKAAKIVKPKDSRGKIARLEAQLDKGDFTLHVDTQFHGYEERPFLEGVFHFKNAGELSAESAMRLAKLCIDKMLERGKRENSIVEDIEGMFTWQVITAEELSELINHLIPDRKKAARKIALAVALSFDGYDEEGAEDTPPVRDDGEWAAADDGPPVPAAFVDTRQADVGTRLPDDDPGPFQDVPSSNIIDARPLSDTPPAGTRLPASSWISGYPELSRLIRNTRLGLVVAGLLIVAGGAITITSLGKRPAGTADTGITSGIASTKAPGEEKANIKGEEPATAPAAQAAAPATTPAPAAPVPAPTPAPRATPPDLTGAPPLVPLTRPAQTITIPVTIKTSASGSLKIDTTDEARAAWVTMGYAVSVSMGLNGKIIRLTDKQGHVYQVETGGLTAGTTTIQATLQPAQ